jgi:hypothetical protein
MILHTSLDTTKDYHISIAKHNPQYDLQVSLYLGTNTNVQTSFDTNAEKF